MDPYFLRSHESARSVGPFRMLVDAASSDGRLTVYEGLLPVGGPPLHVHDFDEILYVLDGRLLVQLRDDLFEAGPGDVAWMPSGHRHAFANPGPEPVRALGIGVPSGIEDLFQERGVYLDGLAEGDAPELARMAEIYARHASRVVGPPIDLTNR